MSEIAVPDLNEDQITAILVESLARGAYESPTGAPPENKDLRTKDAKDMVSLCIRAKSAGNNSDLVNSVLFIAQCDLKPEVIKQEKENKIVTLDDWDFSSVNDKVLEQLIKTVEEQIESPTTLQQKAAFLAEKEKRVNEKQSEGKEVEEVSSGEISSENSETSTQSVEGEIGKEQIISDQAGSSRQSIDGKANEESANAEDAGAFAGAKVTEEGEKGVITSAESQEKDGERDKLLEQLTLPMVEAHKIDINKINDLSIVKLRNVIENPDGKVKDNPADPAANVSPEKVDEVQITSKPKDNNSVAGMDMDAVAEPKIVTKEDLGLAGIETTSGDSVLVSSEREKLEEQLKGTTLKAYGRGRKEVPNIGDNELKLMIDNPEAKIDKSVLEYAVKLDSGITDKTAPEVTTQDPAQSNENTSPDPVAQAKKFLEEAESQQAKVQEELEDEKAKEKIIDEEQVKKIEEESAPAGEKEETITQAAQRVVSNSGTITALDILSKENLPIAPEIEGNPPILPNDISKCSRDEIYSYHARFHACQSRSNFIISNYEDELSDFSFLKKNKEVDIQAEIPAEMDGKRTTQDYRDLMAAADSEVKKLKNKEHELNKVVRKLKVSRDYYHLSCERISRQMSKYETEKADGPR